MSTSTKVEYGVRYQNGDEDWNTRSWFGHLESAEMRESFREQYDLRMAGFGAPKLPLTFLSRTVTTTTSDAIIIDDSVPSVDETDATSTTPTDESSDTGGVIDAAHTDNQISP